MSFSYSLSACCQNGLTFNVSTSDVLPETGLFACIQTLQYSGCVQVITYNSSFTKYNYQSVSPYVFDTCDDCYNFCNCSPSCNTCYEYELFNSGETTIVNFTDCNGYPRQLLLGNGITDYVCAKQGSVTSVAYVNINEGSPCVLAPFSSKCGKFSGTSAPEGVTIEYQDCFKGTNANNKLLTVQYGPSTEIAYCACVQGTIIEGNLEFDGGFVTTCDCEAIPTTPTPTPSFTPTLTPTPNITPSVTPTRTSTPTNTPSNTTSPSVTPTNTITRTVTRSSTTPTPTPTTDPIFDIYLLQPCCGSSDFRLTNIPGTPSEGEILYIKASFFEGCAEIIPRQPIGKIYNGKDVEIIYNVGTCDNAEFCECIQPTPTPTTPCKCSNYNIFNGGTTGYFSYTDCDNNFRTVFLEKGATVALCSCSEKSFILPQFYSYVLVGPCDVPSPTPQPTPTQTPSNSSLPESCTVTGFCLNTYFSTTEIYDGNYYIGVGTYNSRTYYSNFKTGTTGAYIFYNTGTTSWCLSTAIGGNCILQGTTPCNGSCPDFNPTYFSNGVCLTTTTTTSACGVFNFEGYFDCAPTAITPTLSATITPTPTVTITPSSTNYCFSYTGNVSFSSYTSTTTTTTTTTTTINRNLLVTGEENFSLINTIFVSPGQCFWFRLCDSLVDYFIEPSNIFDDVDLIIGRTYDMKINETRYCYIFLGATTASPNGYTTQINNNYVNCGTCISNL